MLTIIAFLLTIAGSVNWLLIGLLQYDFVAGIFGFQASIFSRIIYIIIGASSGLLIYKLFKGKGSIPVFTRNNKKDLVRNIEKMRAPKHEQAFSNVEASNDFSEHDYYEEDVDMKDESPSLVKHKSMFDEHLDES